MAFINGILLCFILPVVLVWAIFYFARLWRKSKTEIRMGLYPKEDRVRTPGYHYAPPPPPSAKHTPKKYTLVQILNLFDGDHIHTIKSRAELVHYIVQTLNMPESEKSFCECEVYHQVSSEEFQCLECGRIIKGHFIKD